jgi:pimeloyl-ACP methyl ester carboxylesterase
MLRDFEVTTPDGRTLACQEGGTPDGFPVIAHWGTPMGRTLFDQHVRAAEKSGIRLVSFDRPGYGGSSPLPGRPVADMANETALVADAIGAQRFATWGISGGGPHALACAALLPTRVTAAASLAAVAPYEADGLDFMAGMGEDNVEEFGAALEGRDVLEPLLEKWRVEMLESESDNALEGFESLLSGPDLQVAKSGDVGRFMTANTEDCLATSAEGWIEDDLAFTQPWGFEFERIRVPVLLLQGVQDLMVPPDHGRWLAERIPNVDARISDEHGHLTLITSGVEEAHSWLLEKSGVVA